MTSITFSSGLGYQGIGSCTCQSSCNSDANGCSQPFGPSFPNLALPGTQMWKMTPMSAPEKIKYVQARNPVMSSGGTPSGALQKGCPSGNAGNYPDNPKIPKGLGTGVW